MITINNQTITKLSLTHKGHNLRFDAHVGPIAYLPYGDKKTSEDVTATIDFVDTYEIDSLIGMLTKLKDAANGQSGTWRPVYPESKRTF